MEDTEPDAWGSGSFAACTPIALAGSRSPAIGARDFLTWVDDEACVGALRLFDPQSGIYLHTGAHRHIQPLVELDKVLQAAREL